MDREHDDLARRVLGQRDPAWPVRHAHDVRHAADHPPGADSGTPGSFHSMTWCSKKTESPGASASSATGTISPSIWQIELEKRNSVMSRSRGASAQPESDTLSLTSSGAPQVVQFVRPNSFWALHHWHSIRSMRTALH